MDIKFSKREAILNAAIKVFSTKGYHNTRMEEIAVVAGVGKGTIYEYFSSKLNLFQEMMEESLRVYYQEINSLRGQDIPFQDRVLLLLEGHIQFCKEHKELTRIVFWDTEIIDEELKEWSYHLRKVKEEQMSAIIKQAVNKGEIKQVNPRILTLMIGGILGSLWAPITLDDWDVDANKLAEEIGDIIMHGIGI